MMKTSILNIYFCLTLLIKLAESAMLFLKVQEIKKTYVFVSLWKAQTNWWK